VLREDLERVQTASGARIELAHVAVAHVDKKRPAWVPRHLLTDDALGVVCDPDIDVVVEAIGGIEPARRLLLAAIADGKSVITANKALLAVHGPELTEAARRKGVHLAYEAAVCAAIPIVRCLRDSLSATPLARITAILNGTTNFILSEMHEHRCSFDEALSLAQARGYAEADASADIRGKDAAAKAILLATIASGGPPSFGRLEGIDGVTPEEIEKARGENLILKLVAAIDLTTRPARASVTLKALQHGDPLAGVGGVDNGVLIETTDGTELFFSGPGAGGEATAVAIVGDVVQVAKERADARNARRLVCA
jgi:homoserine dehydrogenase